MGNKRIVNALIISILSMLIPMVLATTVLKSIKYLIPLYAVGYCVQLMSILYAVSCPKIRFKRRLFGIIIIYLLILVFPYVNDIISDIKIIYYDPINSLIKLINFFFLFIIMQNVKIQENELMRFMKAIVCFSVGICLYSFVFEFHEIVSITNGINTNALKISSVFSNRNQYSAFLVIAVVANLYCNQIQKMRFRHLIYAIQIVGILTTFSRSAFFSLVIIVCMLFFQEKKMNSRKIIAIMLLIVAVAFVMVNASDYILNNYVGLGTRGDSGRFVLWQYAWDIVKDNFITGVGFYTGVDIAMAKGMGLSQFHNMYLDLLVDGGVFEFIFLVVIIYYVYRRCSKKCPNQKLVIVYRASLIAFLFHAGVESLSLFALSYGDTLYTVFYVSLPLLLSNLNSKDFDSSSNEH